jgi:hypothetical protein
MSGPIIAKVWWEAPHLGVLERFMATADVVSFGRGGDCSIRVGHAPVHYDAVPRVWGELTWHRGALDVSNVSPKWGLALVPASDGPGAARIEIPPGGRGASPLPRFRIVAHAPEVTIELNVQTAPLRSTVLANDSGAGDKPSFVPFTLTSTQKLIGGAVIAPLLKGGPRRGSYSEVARLTHYSERTVREAVATMDGLFIVNRLVDPTAGDALDRVSQVLRLHSALLAGSP